MSAPAKLSVTSPDLPLALGKDTRGGLSASRPRTTIAGAGGSALAPVGTRATARLRSPGASATGAGETIGQGTDSSGAGRPVSEATLSQATSARLRPDASHPRPRRIAHAKR